MRQAPTPRSNRKPIRTCLGCRETDLKSALVRFVADAGSAHIDAAAQLSGRGGYLHPRRRCVGLFVAAKRKTFVSLRQGLSRAERQALAEKLEHLVSLSDKGQS